MSDLLVVGADTDAGKTTFALLWLSRFHDRFAAWKPIETGASDTEMMARLVPEALVHPPAARFGAALAPPLAAQREGRAVPSAQSLAAARPSAERLLIESFGGPFSPLNDDELQIDLLRLLDAPLVLVGPSALGAVGRSLAMARALDSAGLRPRGIVLIGPADPWAEQTIRDRSGIFVIGLRSPSAFQNAAHVPWTPDLIRAAAESQAEALDALAAHWEATVAPVAADWQAADRRCVWHPYTPLRGADEPLAVVGAEAEFLHLADGRRVIDGISSWWTTLHGHRHPPLMDALAAASRSIDHVLFAGATHPWAASLAEKLLATAPWDGGRVFFSDNGSTAVEVALKLAYQFWVHRGQPGRTTFVGFENSYHGDTFGAMALSRDPVFFGPFEPLLFKAEILPLDANRLDAFLKSHADEVAAVLIEPILQAAGGMRLHSEQTLGDLFEATRRHGVLFLADEVMTGLGRTGTFWAHQAAGIQPDAIAAAKTLAGGVLPLAATLVAPRLVEAFDSADRTKTFFHGHSFTAHPLACAVALANIPLTLQCVPHVPRAIEAFWRQAFADLADAPGVRDVRIRGVMAAIEVDLPGGYLADVGPELRRAALERGVLLRPLGNVLYALPPWRASRTSLERIAAAMKAAVDSAVATLAK
jgi:adenosylmethionine-8-amino-7-oxononanoate aminotransferase